MAAGHLLRASAAEGCGRTQRTVCRCPLQVRVVNYSSIVCVILLSVKLTNPQISDYFPFLARTVQAFPEGVDDGEVVAGAAPNQQIKRTPLTDLDGSRETGMSDVKLLKILKEKTHI